MQRIFHLLTASGLLLGCATSWADENQPYADAYSSPEASRQPLPNLTIAKGLPRVDEVGIERVRRMWRSYRTANPPVPSPHRETPDSRTAESSEPEK